jgi:hypothetical protein
MHEEGAEWGPFEDPETKDVMDTYPFYFAWCSFKVESPLIGRNDEIQKLL